MISPLESIYNEYACCSFFIQYCLFLLMAKIVLGGARCAEKLFDRMTLRVLQAPMSYFNTTPLGRILNRFTYDTEVLDIEVSTL